MLSSRPCHQGHKPWLSLSHPRRGRGQPQGQGVSVDMEASGLAPAVPVGVLRGGPSRKPREVDVPQACLPERWLQGTPRVPDRGENTEHSGKNQSEDSRVGDSRDDLGVPRVEWASPRSQIPAQGHANPDLQAPLSLLMPRKPGFVCWCRQTAPLYPGVHKAALQEIHAALRGFCACCEPSLLYDLLPQNPL